MRDGCLDTQHAMWFHCDMAKTFKSWDVDQPVLLPPSVHERVPAGHLAHFARNLVRDSLDVSAIRKAQTEDRGFPPYDPLMMVAVLLDAYCQGLYASRRIAQACEERVDVMAVTARQSPDFRTISDFRKRHLSALGRLCTQVLQVCQPAGVVRVGHVALDGTKIRAHASKHKAMSYGRMKTAEPARAAEVAGWLAETPASDACEDVVYGVDQRGDKLPDWVKSKQHRVEKMRAAKAALEAAAERSAIRSASTRPSSPTSTGPPHDRAQRNFPDADRRSMKTRDGFVQGDNAQAAGDADHQVIVAQGLTNQASDAHQLEPMLKQSRRHTGRQARELSADAGYCFEHNLKAVNRRRGRGYGAPGRRQHGEASPTGARQTVPKPRVHALKLRLRRAGWRSRYRLRKQVVDPRVWPDQTGAGLQTVLVAGPGPGRRGVECSLQCPPRAETGWSERRSPSKSDASRSQCGSSFRSNGSSDRLLGRLCLEKLLDSFQILDEAVIFLCTLCCFRMSKNCRWVDGHKDVRSDRRAPRPSSQVIQMNSLFKGRLGCRHTETCDHL